MSNRSHSGSGSGSGDPTDRGHDAPSTDEVARDDPLSADTAQDLRAVADRIDGLAGSLPIGPARHHARRAAMASRTAADGEANPVARRVALGELVTELRTAADEAAATRTQYDLLDCLYEDALPVTRDASGAIYG